MASHGFTANQDADNLTNTQGDDLRLEQEWQKEVQTRKLTRQASLCDFEGCWNRHLYLAQQCNHVGTKYENNEDDVDYWSSDISEAQIRKIEKNRLALIQQGFYRNA